MQTFMNYFWVAGGITAGIVIILLPLAGICFGIKQVYAIWILKRFRREARNYTENLVDEEVDQSQEADNIGTPPFV